jgi:hypothetical protein
MHPITHSLEKIQTRAPQPFQALTGLRISCYDMSIFASLLYSIPMTDFDTSRCPNLKRIHIIARRCSFASIWYELLTILARTKLEHILIVEKCDYKDVPCHAVL